MDHRLGAPAARASRIEADVERIKDITRRINNSTDVIVGQARMLGYFSPPAPDRPASPSPVVTTLDDAINDLIRSVEALDGSMNLFH